jgi:hypothetical protein
VREEDEHRLPRMERRRSRSAGEVLWERRGYEFVYPAAGGGRGIGTGGDAEEVEEEEERSVRLQGVPPGVGTETAMGRQRSRSAGESSHPYPRPHSQPHHQEDGHPAFEFVYHGVGMQAGVGGAAAGEPSTGLES